MSRFAGVKVLVTGAADGIGQATAAAFAEAGASVLGADLNRPEADPGFAFVTQDVSSADAPAALAQAVVNAKTELEKLREQVQNIE